MQAVGPLQVKERRISVESSRDIYFNFILKSFAFNNIASIDPCLPSF